jgi:hypothetical protein
MAKHRRYSRQRAQKGGLVDGDRQTLLGLGFTEDDINYIFARHKNMPIEFFINSVNGIPGNQFYPHPQTPQEIMERLRDEGDDTDPEYSDTDNSVMDGGKRRYKRRTTNKRKTNKRNLKKSKKTRKHRKRKHYGGGFTTSISTPLTENKNDYNTYVKLGLREY